MTKSTPQSPNWITAVSVAILLGLHVLLALGSVAGKSVTVDEIFHVTGGYLFDRYGDYRIHSDNGILPQRAHALPALLIGAKPPPFENNGYWTSADVNQVSHQFFYESGNDHWLMLRGARAMNLGFSLGAGLLVFFWARHLAGDTAGLVALGLLMLSPTFLAHGPLATSDAAAALFLSASSGAYWWQLRRPNNQRVVISAVIFGLACVAKFSAVLLAPIFAILTFIYILVTPRNVIRSSRIAGSLLCHAAIAWLIIWACFGFRYSTFSPNLPGSDTFGQTWAWLLEHMGWQAGVIDFFRRGHLLPEGFLFGYTHAYVGAQDRGAFLAGNYSTQGWIEFFPLAFLWKSTPAELTGLSLAAVAAALHWRQMRIWALRLAPLLTLALVYGGAALTSHLNIGHRHLLPLYPGLCLIAAIAALRIAATPRLRYTFAALLLVAQGASASQCFPNYLAYFNSFSGGSANGWRLLVDSSLDWGQDLPGLKNWLLAYNSGPHPQPVFLSYFGSGEPEYYDLKITRLPYLNGFRSLHPWYEPKGGLYCISATILQQVYSPAHGEWSVQREKEYQELRAKDPLFREYWRNPEIREELNLTRSAGAFEETWQRYDVMRLARLTAYLRAKKPTATIGYSIFIYELSEAEVNSAVNQNYGDWLRAIQNAAPL